MSAQVRSQALIPQRSSAEGRPVSTQGRSQALIPQRAARRAIP